MKENLIQPINVNFQLKCEFIYYIHLKDAHKGAGMNFKFKNKSFNKL